MKWMGAMTFNEEKKLCGEDGVYDVGGLLMNINGANKPVDKCRLTGARCCSKKCPKFHRHIKPTNSLANVGLEEQYAEEMGAD